MRAQRSSLFGTRSAVGSNLVSANTALGDATGLYGIAGDIEHPTVAGAVIDSTRVASTIAGSGTTLGTQLAGAATGFGAAYGVVAGFEQGGALGGLESAASLETLAPLVGLTGGVALPIAIGAGLISAIFGGNHDVPANMPDKYDTQRFGQELADLGGTSGANGQSWLASMFSKLKAMFGESATSSGRLNFEHAIGNEWVTGAAGTDARHYKYTDLASALYDFVNAKVANAPATSAATGVASVAAVAGTPTSISSGLSQAPPDTGRDTIEIVARRPIETPVPGVSTNVGLLAATYGAHERYFNDQRSSRALAM
jgi:hypothetical protein